MPPLPARPNRPSRSNPEQNVPEVTEQHHALPTRPNIPAPAYNAPVASPPAPAYVEEEVVAPVYEEQTYYQPAEPETQYQPEYETPAAEVDYDNDYKQDDDSESAEEEQYISPEEAALEDEINSLSPAVRENAMKLLELISDGTSSEVIMNGPSDIIFKKSGQRYFADGIDFGDTETYHKVINTLILSNTDTTDRIGTTPFLIEGQLELPDLEDPENNPPMFARVHILAPPAVTDAKVTIAKKAKHQFTVDDLLTTGSMSSGMASFMKALARGRATMVFSGLSGSGKTTLLEALSYHFDPNDRVIVVEDTAELSLPIADVVPLRSTSRKPGAENVKNVSLEWLVQQANRMRPDRIIVGEVRGSEMAEFLTAANSGADGSMTTVHASSPRQTIDKIVSLSLKSDSAKNQEAIFRDVATTIQIIVQTSLVDGRHIVANIEEVSDTIVRGGAGVATNPIFEYDRNLGIFKAVGRPSEALTSFLAQRGVSVEPSWFNRGV